MPHSFDLYITNLVNDILWASSQDEVKDLFTAITVVLEQKEADVQKRIAIIQRLKEELNLFNPFNKDAQQWSNITMAKILLNRYLKEQSITVTDED